MEHAHTMWQSVTTAVSQATFIDWMLLASGVLLILYILGTWNYDYFQKQGIPSTKNKLPFLGDNISALVGLTSFPELVLKLYNEGAGHDVYGTFEFTKPMFLIRDPELLKIVAVKEFDYFMNHRTIQNEKADPVFSKNLANLKDQAWRDMRATLSPAFTTSKIKAMFPLVSQCADQMAQHLRQEYAQSKEGSNKQPLPTDMKDLFTRLATDVIATAAFGVGCDSLKDPENEFYRMGKALTTFTLAGSLKLFGYILFPKVMEALKVRILHGRATDFFDSLVQETVRERKKKGIFRPDMLQLLMQAREGQLKAEKEDTGEAEDVGAKKTKLEDDDISAQALIFFLADFETISVALCITTYALSHHPEVLKRLLIEIDKMMEETGRIPTYEIIQKMKYLNAVINEALRIYPPAVATDRLCQKDIQMPGGPNSSPFLIRKGDVISIPIMRLHHDPQYWPEPEKFDPDRFSEENKHNIKPFTYMPFGVGPRICIESTTCTIGNKTGFVGLTAQF